MLKAIDVANFFIELSNSFEEDLITNMKVNKLVYFAQAWSLVRLNKSLFDEDIQAWTYGPVIPSVYNAFKPCGKNNIEATMGDYTPDKFNDEELELLMDVAMQYGQYTAPALVNITHKADSPWAKVYADHRNNVISNDLIKEYFSALTPLPKFSVEVKEDDFVGYRDEDGFLVLPKEYDDEQ